MFLRYFLFISFLVSSCTNGNVEESDRGQLKNEPNVARIGKMFIHNLYDLNTDSLRIIFDPKVISIIGEEKLVNNFKILSKKLRSEYKGPVTATLISKEKTIYENLPSIFLIFKIESEKLFGYYFFYVNEATEKILLVSEFSNIKEKNS